MSNPLTPAEIAELDRLNAARTQGEWFDIEHPEWSGSNHRIDTKATAAWCNFGQICYTSAPNAAFIVAAANNMDRLLTTIKELREAAAAYQELVVCYRMGRRPTEKLFKRLDKARIVMETTDWEGRVSGLAGTSGKDIGRGYRQ